MKFQSFKYQNSIIAKQNLIYVNALFSHAMQSLLYLKKETARLYLKKRIFSCD